MNRITRRNFIGAITLRQALLAGAVGLVASGALAAGLDHYSVATYNSQGDKWATDIAILAKKYEVLAIQEVGNEPKVWGNGKQLKKVYCADQSNRLVSFEVKAFTWDRQRAGASYVYFLGSNRERVNAAFVLQKPLNDPANDVAIVCPQPDNTRKEKVGRPILGIKMPEGQMYFTMHAGSYGDNLYNDADNIVEAVSGLDVFQKDTSLCWAILGDFNREPDGFSNEVKNAYPRVNPGQPTHMSGKKGEKDRELDFMIVRDKKCEGDLVASVPNGYSSDHLPVEFKAGKKR